MKIKFWWFLLNNSWSSERNHKLASSNSWEKKSPFGGLCNCVCQKWGHANLHAIILSAGNIGVRPMYICYIFFSLLCRTLRLLTPPTLCSSTYWWRTWQTKTSVKNRNCRLLYWPAYTLVTGKCLQFSNNSSGTKG